jgi:predicted phage terminase large subunit-like protein
MLNDIKLQKYLLLKEKRKRQVERSFYEFVKDAFEVLHSNEKIVDNWHIKYLCDILQAEIFRIIEGRPKTQDIIINIPPRSLKSFICTIVLPAWAWLHKPSLKFIGSSYSSSLAIEHNVKTRRIVESQWYKEHWGTKINLANDQNTKSEFENTAQGVRRSTSTGGAVTGSGADVIIIDDPLNPKQARSDVERANANKFFNETLITRLNRPEIGLFIVVMQRLHEDDLTGHLLKKNKKQYRHICIPAEFTKDVQPSELETYYKDGLFFPERFTKSFLTSLKDGLGSFGYAGQLLQSPSPDEGGIFKKHLWVKYNKPVEKFDQIIDSWDCTFKGLATSDYVACTVWGVKGADRYLLHAEQKRMGFVDTIDAILNIRKRFDIKRTIIEDKANGTPIIEVLKKRVLGVIAYNPGTKSKEERAYAIEPQLEAGNVYIPTSSIATFDIEEYVDECAKFPNGLHDDLVDSTTMALLYLSNKSNNRLKAMGLF